MERERDGESVCVCVCVCACACVLACACLCTTMCECVCTCNFCCREYVTFAAESILQREYVCIECVAVCCSVLQCDAVYVCIELKPLFVNCTTLQHTDHYVCTTICEKPLCVYHYLSKTTICVAPFANHYLCTTICSPSLSLPISFSLSHTHLLSLSLSLSFCVPLFANHYLCTTMCECVCTCNFCCNS